MKHLTESEDIVSDGGCVRLESHRMQQGAEIMTKTTAVLVVVVLSLVAACAPAAPTPTRAPEPTATLAEVRATKPEHLAGIWVVPWDNPDGQLYVRFEGDGIMCHTYSPQELEECPADGTRFWFEDGVYYEDFGQCLTIGSYRAYLEIQGGQAVGLRFEVIGDTRYVSECNRDYRMTYRFARVDE